MFYFSEKIRKDSKFFLSLLNTFDEPIFLKDENFEIVAVNDAYCELSEMSPEELFANGEKSFFSKKAFFSLQKADEFILKTKKTHVCRKKFLSVSGRIYKVSIRKNSLIAPCGKIYVLGKLTEIADYEQSQIILKQGRERLSKVFKASPQAIMLIRIRDLRFLEVNDMGLKMLGYSYKEFFPSSLSSLKIIAEKDLKIIATLLNKYGAYKDLELDYFTKSNERRVGLFSGELIDFEGEKCLIQIVNDITERKNSQRALEKSEEDYRLLAESIPLGIIMIDLKGKILYANACVKKILNAPSLEDVLKINMFRNAKIKSSGIFENILKCINTDQTVEFEMPFDFRWVKNIYVHIYLSPIRSFSGTLSGVQILVEDITKRKLSEEKYKTLFETTSAATMIIENDYSISLANKRTSQLSGYSKDEIENKMTILDFVATKDCGRIKHYHVNRRKGFKNVPNSYEAQILADKGSREFPALINVAVIPNTFQSVASIVDLSEIKMTKKALKSESSMRRELENVINQGPLIVLSLKNRENWPVFFVSENISQFGFNYADFLCKNFNFANVIFEEDFEKIKEKMFNFAFDEIDDYVLNYRIINEKGDLFWVEHRVWVKRDVKGEIVYYQGFLFDISERKKAEDKSFELFKHLGTVNRKVAILADLNRQYDRKPQRYRLDAITRSARNISHAVVSLFYEYDPLKKKFYLLVADEGDLDDGGEFDSIKVLDASKANWLKKFVKEKVRYQGGNGEIDAVFLNFGGALNSFVFLPLFKNGKLFAALFLGFSEKTPLNTQELAFYDLFVIQAAIMLNKQ